MCILRLQCILEDSESIHERQFADLRWSSHGSDDPGGTSDGHQLHCIRCLSTGTVGSDRVWNPPSAPTRTGGYQICSWDTSMHD